LEREAQLMDRYTKAIDQLGDPDDSKVDRRLGGIYALRRIAEDSLRDQPSVVEVLCAFIRRRGQSPGVVGAQAVDDYRQPVDVQMALTAIGSLPRLGKEHERIDISRSHLECVELDELDFSHAHLSEANFSYAHMDSVNFSHVVGYEVNLNNAILRRAHMEKAQLKGVQLRHAKLVRANLTEASLPFANLEQANLRGAQLCKAELRKADLSGAHLSSSLQPPESGREWERIEAATLRGAALEGAFLSGAHLAGVDLKDVDLKGADLSNAIGVSQGQLEEAIGDERTRLPPGLERPKSWTSPRRTPTDSDEG
jgi:uncharacterized protein YjbI with pentapeptide repeats